MENKTIGDIYAANDQIRGKFKSIIANVTEEQARTLPEGEKWTFAEFVEHIGIVENEMIKACAKLLEKAQADNKSSDGSLVISDNFLEKSVRTRAEKLEAPERVRPTGTPTVAQSVVVLDTNRKKLNELRPLFEQFDGSEHTFPHPYFGGLTAHEWLVLIGGHEARHLAKIEKYVEML